MNIKRTPTQPTCRHRHSPPPPPLARPSDIIRGPVHTRAIGVNTYTDIRGGCGERERGESQLIGVAIVARDGQERRRGESVLQVYRPNIPSKSENSARKEERSARFKVSSAGFGARREVIDAAFLLVR